MSRITKKTFFRVPTLSYMQAGRRRVLDLNEGGAPSGGSRPATPGLGNQCSIQLSYGSTSMGKKQIQPVSRPKVNDEPRLFIITH